ncbi:hypothetical protein K2173_002726 [Erythroxylum novogranatense]|uniref:Cytochrome P450 n=1 Tax=Erythroxylum novogranatense TaxID=1862640 RepID=A0AAV8TR17_9ROSI|nr:hypothetical protein K2173_002726 [Erythroxylum novogranatense]
MELSPTHVDSTLWLFSHANILHADNLILSKTLLSLAVFTILLILAINLPSWAFSGGGLAWKNGRTQMGRIPIPGSRGLPFFGSLFTLSRGLAQRSLACMASNLAATQLMAFSLGSTPAIVTSDPQVAREILNSPHFADRPIKLSAKSLGFSRAIGFSPNGTYWRLLRKVASTHLFSPKRIAAHESSRQLDCAIMLRNICNEQSLLGAVELRKHLQDASLNNIMGIVFGKRYDESNIEEAKELQELVNEGFELLGAFNWSDYLPCLNYFCDPFHIKQRCSVLLPRVEKFVKRIIVEHRIKKLKSASDGGDFVDVLLSLQGDEKLEEDDMVAVLWEMIFRGTDSVALLTEWIMAELVLNPDIQAKLRQEVDSAQNCSDTAKLPYLQAVVKESLRLHPPGPLLSWARLSTSDACLSNGMVVPKKTTAMVNMWAITHDPRIWVDALVFKPERFMESHGGADVDVRGGDLRLAPFGAGRRVCPGKNLGFATVSLWVAKLVQHFEWVEDGSNPVDLSEVLKLSCTMKNPLSAIAVPRNFKISST